MAKIKLNNGVEVGDYLRPYITAEVNSSHNGNVETAKEMIRTAKDIGCQCVKFQSWSKESLYSKTFYDKNPISKRIVSKFALDQQMLEELALYCRELEIDFSSTPYSKEEVDFLVKQCNIPYIKIASMEINNYDFLKYIANTGSAMVLATGMADMDEITKAVQAIESTGNRRLCILHCVSVYPAAKEMIQLNNIAGLRERFAEYPIGYSDHSIGTEMAVAATALGAGMIEKHFTLDNKKMGMDNNMATEPDVFAQLVEQCNNVYDGMGSKERIVITEEMEQRKKMRRSIIVTQDLEAGAVLTREVLDVKRPGDGIAPEKLEQLIGCSLRRSVAADEILTYEDIES